MNNYTQEDAQAIVASVLNYIIKCSHETDEELLTTNGDIVVQKTLHIPYVAVQEIASVWQLVVKK